MKAGRHLAKRALSRCRVEGLDINQVYLVGPKGLGATEYLGDIEAGLEVVKDENKRLRAGRGQHVTLALLGIALHRIMQALAVGKFAGSACHWQINQSYRLWLS